MQVRNDAALDWGGSSYKGREKWSDSRRTLKIKPTGFAQGAMSIDDTNELGEVRLITLGTWRISGFDKLSLRYSCDVQVAIMSRKLAM